MKVVDLRVLHMENPMGIDVQPYFSWMMESDEQDTMQTSYRLTVSDEDGTKVWDTGLIDGDESAYVMYEGQPLRSRTTYRVQVTVRDNHDHEAAAETTFETALLSLSDWSAQWAESSIRRRKGRKGFGRQYPATMFRKEFPLHGSVRKARCYITCHGIYQLHMNGHRIGHREFAPEHTVYDQYLCYQIYDVTSDLTEGQNAIGIYVGDGWYLSPYVTPNIKGMRHAHAVLFQIEVEYADGTSERIVSDEQLRVSYGPVRSADLFDGELYDARLEAAAWTTPGYSADGWKAVTIRDYPRNNLHAQLGSSVQEIMTIHPVQLIHTPAGEQVLDFGQNIAGRVRARISAPAGTEVALEHCEVLDEHGNYYNNIMSTSGSTNGCQQKDVYISNGTKAIYEPLFTFHGFRYVKITGIETVDPADYEAVVLSSEQESVGTFTCSDDRLNRLYENTRWSQRANMFSIPTDCPQREKAGWTGDIQIYAPTALKNADLTIFLTRWLFNLACDQGQYGEVPIVVPYDGPYPFLGRFIFRSPGRNSKATSAGWGDAAVLVPYAMYQVTGNRAILLQQYDSMQRWCDYIINEARSRKPRKPTADPSDEPWLWDTGFHFGEWLIPSLSGEGLGNNQGLKTVLRETPKYTAPIFGWLSVSRFAEIAAALERTEDAARYQEIAENMRRAIRHHVIRPDGTMAVEFMGAYVLALYFDLVPESCREATVQHLVSMIRQNRTCLDTGFLATPYLLDTLCKNGQEALAYELLWQDQQPSWLFEVDHGATTIWESWYAYNKDGCPMRVSMNHYAFGCVDDWIFRMINGMDAILPGFKRIRIAPHPDGRLTSASRSYRSTYGTIVSDWRMEDGMLHLHVEIPCNTTAEICLPNGESHSVGSGSYDYQCVM